MSEPAWIPVGPAAVLDVGPEVAYAEVTASVAVTPTTEAGATPIVTAPAFNADGNSQYVVEAQMLVQPPGTSGQAMVYVLYLDGVSIGLLGQTTATGATAPILPIRLSRRLTPAAGSRVFSIRAYVSSGTGNVFAGAGGVGINMPAFIRITKVPSAVAGPAGLVPPTAIGTVLPASPVDGQEFILTDSLTAPTFTWHLRYMAAKASNKWVFVGGSPLSKWVGTSESTTTAGLVFVNLATVGPDITIPLAGTYEINLSATLMRSAADPLIQAAVGIGDYAAGSHLLQAVMGAYGAGVYQQATAWGIVSGLAAGATLRMRYMQGNAGTLTVSNRQVGITPVAVGG